MKYFGSQIDFAIDVWRAKHYPVDCGDDDESQRNLELAKKWTQLIIQVVISLALVIMCFFVIFKSDSANMQKACFGLLGTVVGYWFH